MALVQYAGALAPKKKQELAEIAQKMSLEISGTKEELHARIKAYLESNDLTSDPMFSGLYPSKKRPSRKETSSSLAVIPKGVTSDEESSSLKRRGSTRRKVTPPPLYPAESEMAVATLTAPPSPVRALISNVEAAISNAFPDAQTLAIVTEKTSTTLQTRAKAAYAASRKFMSSATNIASVTVLFEFLFILASLLQWQYYELPVAQPGTTVPIMVSLPTLDAFLTFNLYKQLFWWSLPTIAAPQIAGSLISFTTPPKDIDPLSAGIVKLALTAILDDSWYVIGGRTVQNWRMVAASTNLAFAMAEAVEERRVVTREHAHST